MERRTINTRFTTREDGEERRISGYFAVFGDMFELEPGVVETIDPHAFDETINDDIRALWNHNSDIVLGRSTAGTASFKIDGHGLFGEMLINNEDRAALDCWARNKRGDVTQASFGFDILEQEWEFFEDGTATRTITKVKLYEVSPCTFPAYEGTDIKARCAEERAKFNGRLAAKKEMLKERMKKWH